LIFLVLKAATELQFFYPNTNRCHESIEINRQACCICNDDGSALAIPWENENIPAIINAWYGGQSAGTAIADVLFGDYNPAGRLPVLFIKVTTICQTLATTL
jgi:hypothetical protein